MTSTPRYTFAHLTEHFLLSLPIQYNTHTRAHIPSEWTIMSGYKMSLACCMCARVAWTKHGHKFNWSFCLWLRIKMEIARERGTLLFTCPIAFFLTRPSNTTRQNWERNSHLFLPMHSLQMCLVQITICKRINSFIHTSKSRVLLSRSSFLLKHIPYSHLRMENNAGNVHTFFQMNLSLV